MRRKSRVGYPFQPRRPLVEDRKNQESPFGALGALPFIIWFWVAVWIAWLVVAYLVE